MYWTFLALGAAAIAGYELFFKPKKVAAFTGGAGVLVVIPPSSQTIDRSVDPPASLGAVSPPTGGRATFTNLHATTAQATTLPTGDVLQGTLVAEVSIAFKDPTTGASVLDGATYPVIWVSPDASRIAIGFKRSPAVLPPSFQDGILIATKG